MGLRDPADARRGQTPNPAKPEPSTPPGNSNLETRNPKQSMKNQNSRKTELGLLGV
jgi:hypothetical protein